MQELKVIVTGYDHYEGVDVNPSYEVPRALAEGGAGRPDRGRADAQEVLDGVDLEIKAVSLPVSFARAWPILHGVIEDVKPDIVIATGLKHKARGIAMERCAVNLKEVSDDRDEGDLVREPVNPGGPAAYWTRLPLRAILHDFAHSGIPATLSSDAGTYVCNALFYSLLDWASSHPTVLAGFVSLPLVNESAQAGCGLPLAQQVRAGQEVVRETARYYLQPSSSPILLA
ncbi:pyroglutamyl-peptidase I [Bifidobacterium favimelis]|uniref:Pyroglutamyl-peptidase I n=1 Tax=Bifidobacterium favimelis TaxID=3122979 RepID=A0ABU8ZM74_9BIFI